MQLLKVGKLETELTTLLNCNIMKKLEKEILKYCKENNIILVDNRVHLSELNKSSANVFYTANLDKDNSIIEFIIDKFTLEISL